MSRFQVLSSLEIFSIYGGVESGLYVVCCKSEQMLSCKDKVQKETVSDPYFAFKPSTSTCIVANIAN